MQLQICYIFTNFAVFCFSSYLSPSGGSYGVIANSRIKRRPSSHFEMEINECEFLCVNQNKELDTDVSTATVTVKG